MSFNEKYLKYKHKYLNLKNKYNLSQFGGSDAAGAGAGAGAGSGEQALANAHFARACALGARGGWLEMEGAAGLCKEARNEPERMQGVSGEEHNEGRTRLEFAVKSGDAGAVARLMDEGGEVAWKKSTELMDKGGEEVWKEWYELNSTFIHYTKGIPQQKMWRSALFEPVTLEEGTSLRPGFRLEDHGSSLAVLRERAPNGGPFVMSLNKYGQPDFGPPIHTSEELALWRASFHYKLPMVVNLEEKYKKFKDDDLIHIRGINAVSIAYCMGLTDAAFVHLEGVKVLDITADTMQSRSGRDAFDNYRDPGLVHLRGIHTLIMRNNCGFSNAGFVNLRGINTLIMSGCQGLTDVALSYLEGIKILDISCYPTIYLFEVGPNISDAGLVYLKGIHVLIAQNQNFITDAGLVHLKGIKILDISNYQGTRMNITEAGLIHLHGIKKLRMRGCNPINIAAARSVGLNVIED
jgi:hypothetical protein